MDNLSVAMEIGDEEFVEDHSSSFMFPFVREANPVGEFLIVI